MAGQRKETAVWRIPSKHIRGRRRGRLFLWNISWVGVVVLLALPIAEYQFGESHNPDWLRWYAGVALPVAVFAGAAWFHHRPTLLAINRVAVNETGLYPPFKPKAKLSKEDWFIPYQEIVSMQPVAKEGRLALAYDVTLRDGFTFQLNAMDLLVYVDEREVRRYAKLLQTIREQLEKPENRLRAEGGQDIIIPRGHFVHALQSPPTTQKSPKSSMFWYFLLIGLVAGFVAALIIGFAVLR
jgi:hypothetical protein